MTSSQAALVENNLKLVNKALDVICHRRDKDEYLAIGYMSLCKAALTYNPNKGKFSTYAYFIITRDLRTEWVNRKKRYSLKTLSYDSAIEIDGEDVFLDELIPDLKTNVEETAEVHELYDHVVDIIEKYIDPIGITIFNGVLEGKTLSTIASNLNCSKQWVSYKFNKTCKKVRDIFNKTYIGV